MTDKPGNNSNEQFAVFQLGERTVELLIEALEALRVSTTDPSKLRGIGTVSGTLVESLMARDLERFLSSLSENEKELSDCGNPNCPIHGQSVREQASKAQLN